MAGEGESSGADALSSLVKNWYQKFRKIRRRYYSLLGIIYISNTTYLELWLNWHG